jgi:hypothetical protein
LKARVELPAQPAHLLEVIDARVPGVEADRRRLQAALGGGAEHGPEVGVLGQAVRGLAVDAEVDGDVAVAVSVRHRQQVDAPHDALVLAGEVAADQLDLFALGLVQGGVVQHQGPALEAAQLRPGLLPEFAGAAAGARQQAAEGVVGRVAGRLWLDTLGLDAAESARRGDQELDVVFRLALRIAHNPIVAPPCRGELFATS